MNILVVNEDYNLISKINTSLKSIENITYNCFETSDEACDYIENNTIDIAVLSLTMPIMNGDEMADVIYASNPSAKFCFLFDEKSIEVGVESFNSYIGCRILDKNRFNPDEFLKAILYLIDEYEAEDRLNEALNKYRDKEKAYKDAMSEMSGLLNSRISCYSRVTKVYSKSIEELCEQFPEEIRINIEDFFNCVFGQYIQDVLVESVDIQKSIEGLIDSINDREAQRHFQFVYDCELPVGKVSEDIVFSAHFLSHLFAKFLQRFRVKLDLKEGPKAYRLDVLVDTRLGNVSKELLDLLSNAAKASLESICYKLEHGSKDGIIQIRLYYLKEIKNGKET